MLLAGGSIIDAVEQGIWVTGCDTHQSVGLGGLPNAAGVVQLDASIMSGPGHTAGSVAGLEGIRHPISAARRVMEKTPHVMLVGEGARMFALEQGFSIGGDQFGGTLPGLAKGTCEGGKDQTGQSRYDRPACAWR